MTYERKQQYTESLAGLVLMGTTYCTIVGGKVRTHVLRLEGNVGSKGIGDGVIWRLPGAKPHS